MDLLLSLEPSSTTIISGFRLCLIKDSRHDLIVRPELYDGIMTLMLGFIDFNILYLTIAIIIDKQILGFDKFPGINHGIGLAKRN